MDANRVPKIGRPPRAHEVIPDLRLRAADELRLLEAIDAERRDAQELGAIMGEQDVQRRAGLSRARRAWLAVCVFFGGGAVVGWASLILLLWPPWLYGGAASGLALLVAGLGVGLWSARAFLRHTLPLRPEDHAKTMRKYFN